MKALKGRRNWGRLIGLVMGLLSVGVSFMASLMASVSWR